jgi:hypothetical protein
MDADDGAKCGNLYLFLGEDQKASHKKCPREKRNTHPLINTFSYIYIYIKIDIDGQIFEARQHPCGLEGSPVLVSRTLHMDIVKKPEKELQ